jgi:hypothetical protein
MNRGLFFSAAAWPMQAALARRGAFNDPSFAYRRLFSELLGTFMLVLVAAGGGILHAKGQISLSAAVDRARLNGDGDHPVHGRGVGRAPQSGRVACVRVARRLFVELGIHFRPPRRVAWLGGRGASSGGDRAPT